MNTMRVELSHSNRSKRLILFGPKYVTIECRNSEGVLCNVDIDTDTFLELVVKLPVVQGALSEY